MKLSYKMRRRLSIIILVLVLPTYIIAAVTIMNILGRQQIYIELLIYVVLGILWAVPFKFIFKGIGKPDPDKKNTSE